MPDTRATSQADSMPSAVRGLRPRVAIVAIAAVLVAALTSCGSPANKYSGRRSGDRADLTTLVASTTGATLPRAPQDPDPLAATGGEVVHPRGTLPLYAAPGRRPFAKITPKQMGDTWLPVVDQKGDWFRVLLPSRPNGSTGWLRTARLDRRQTPYLIRVHLGSRQLELLRDGDPIGSWSVAVGAPETPTPVGRTFLLGSIVDPDQSFSPLILPLGPHSDTLVIVDKL